MAIVTRRCGKNLWEIGAFKDIAESKEMFATLQEKEYVRYENLPLEARDGHRVDVEFVSNVYAANLRRVIQCNIRDITEHKQTKQDLRRVNAELEAANQRMRESEELLKKSESKFKSIFDAANDAIYIHDMETGQILDVNHKTCEMYKFTREEMLSRTVEDVSSGQAPFSQREAVDLIRKASEEGPQLFDGSRRTPTAGFSGLEGHLASCQISLGRSESWRSCAISPKEKLPNRRCSGQMWSWKVTPTRSPTTFEAPCPLSCPVASPCRNCWDSSRTWKAFKQSARW